MRILFSGETVTRVRWQMRLLREASCSCGTWRAVKCRALGLWYGVMIGANVADAYSDGHQGITNRFIESSKHLTECAGEEMFSKALATQAIDDRPARSRRAPSADVKPADDGLPQTCHALHRPEKFWGYGDAVARGCWPMTTRSEFHPMG